MCNKLLQIYQRRTPTFLAEITAIVAALVLLIQPLPSQCGSQPAIHQFTLLVVGLGATEMVLKLVVFTFLYWRNRELANSYNTVILFMVAAAHLALWIFSISLLSNREMAVCPIRDRFFVKSYVFVYGTMIVGWTVLFIVLLLSAAGVTFAVLKKNKKEEGEDIEL